LLVVSVILFVTGIFFHYFKSNNYFVDMLLAIASVLLFIYFFGTVNDFRSESASETEKYLVLAGILIYALIVFYLKQTLWLKSLLILLCLTMFLIKFEYYFGFSYSRGRYSSALLSQFINSAISWLMLGGLVCFYFIG
ncbi:MAG TPA: hypothetical protein DD638_03385, partial [Pasteurellaceae bacterium]|nr:hypothetical protein [Pasteurellaceae bacterium]